MKAVLGRHPVFTNEKLGVKHLLVEENGHIMYNTGQGITPISKIDARSRKKRS